MRIKAFCLLMASLIISFASCGKKNEQPQAGLKAVPKEVVTHCGPYLSGDENSYDSGNTSVGLLTKQDSIEIEQLTGRKIIGEIDTTEFFHYGESMWHYLKQERDFVKRNVDLAFDYNLSEYYSAIHFFYDEELNCHYDCPDMFVWLSDGEAEKLRKHISKIKEGDSIIIEKGDTIIRTVHKKHKLSATLKGNCLGSCDGYKTTLFLYLKMHGLVIHNHHQYFCQTHMTPSIYERKWIIQNERKKKRK